MLDLGRIAPRVVRARGVLVQRVRGLWVASRSRMECGQRALRRRAGHTGGNLGTSARRTGRGSVRIRTCTRTRTRMVGD